MFYKFNSIIFRTKFKLVFQMMMIGLIFSLGFYLKYTEYSNENIAFALEIVGVILMIFNAIFFINKAMEIFSKAEFINAINKEKLVELFWSNEIEINKETYFKINNSISFNYYINIFILDENKKWVQIYSPNNEIWKIFYKKIKELDEKKLEELRAKEISERENKLNDKEIQKKLQEEVLKSIERKTGI